MTNSNQTLNDNLIRRVLDLVSRIPKGRVTTYGRIAAILGIKSPRAIGKVLHHNTNPKKYPCHRVVFRDGSLAEHYAFGGKKAQMEKLRKEKVTFKLGKVNLKKHLL